MFVVLIAILSGNGGNEFSIARIELATYVTVTVTVNF